MEIPDGAVEKGMEANGWSADLDTKRARVLVAQRAVLEWLVENDPGFLLRLVFSEKQLERFVWLLDRELSNARERSGDELDEDMLAATETLRAARDRQDPPPKWMVDLFLFAREPERSG